MKNTLLEYLDFTRSERRGLFYLFVLILFLFSLPKMTSFFIKEKTYDYTAFEQEINEWEENLINQDSLRQSQYEARKKNWGKKKSWTKKKDWGNKKGDSKKKIAVTLNPFPFNPNEASKSQLLDLGLPERTVKVFLNFRNKGGQFYKNTDLKKVYGFKKEWYDELEPFIRIKKEERTYADNNYKKNTSKKEKDITASIPKSYERDSRKKMDSDKTEKKYEREAVIVDINDSSPDDFQKVYGIGPYYANKIVEFRELLGGFVRVEQLSEMYGMPDSTYQKIKPSLKIGTISTRKININTATADDLKIHPYIKWKLANSIVKYRKTHGKYDSVSDLKKNYAMSSDMYNKLEPYLTVE